MRLTKEEEKILDGEYGEVKEKMFRILVTIGDIYNADRMIKISSTHISGVSYKSIGDFGLEFLEDLARGGAEVCVPSYLNPAGVDMRLWKELGFPRDFVRKQIRIINAFNRMGIYTTLTCTPYLIGNLPRFGDHVAWAESSAVSFANSVLGARTNRESGISALASAICGCTPNYGLHIKENRRPEIVVNVRTRLQDPSDFGLLGYILGKSIKNKIPYIRGVKSVEIDHLKALGAAMAASGAIAMYHVEGITPEYRDFDINDLENLDVEEDDLRDAKEEFLGERIDAIMIGCPHASLNEIARIARMVEKIKLKKPLWIFTSRFIRELAYDMGYGDIIERSGGKIIADTCMVVSPVEDLGFEIIGVDSGKAANYLPTLCKCRVVFGSVEELLEMIS